MGLLDLPKLALKARQMQKKMSGTKSVGKHGDIALIMNGLYSIVTTEPDYEALYVKFPNIDKNELRRLVDSILKDTSKALDDAKNQLQKSMADTSSLDDFREMLG